MKIEIKPHNQEAVSYKKIIQKTVNTKAKAGLRSLIMVQD